MAAVDKGVYWFPAKRHGWGWGFPITWQGWVVFAAFLGILVGAGTLLMPLHVTAFLVVSLLASLALIAVCHAKGEPARRRRGG